MLKQGIDVIVNSLLPPRCASCGVVVQSAGAVCGTCWQGLTFLSAPWCSKCGKPYEYAGQDESCDCLNDIYTKGRSALAYDDNSRALFMAFKHGGKTHLSGLLSNWLLQAGNELWGQTDLLLPVPLYWSRQLYRKYNQAALLTRDLSKKVGIDANYHCLLRKQPSLKRGIETRAARIKNRDHAFYVNNPELVKGKRVMVIDDVWTTGATLNACAKTLFEAGARDVFVMAVARRFI